MKIGIDSYTFHRYFGEIRPAGVEADPGTRWTVFDLIAYARTGGGDGLSLETCYMPALDLGFLRELRGALDDSPGSTAVLAWGHPVGLERGTSRAALDDLKRHIPSALELGCRTMRITAPVARFPPSSKHSSPAISTRCCAKRSAPPKTRGHTRHREPRRLQRGRVAPAHRSGRLAQPGGDAGHRQPAVGWRRSGRRLAQAGALRGGHPRQGPGARRNRAT